MHNFMSYPRTSDILSESLAAMEYGNLVSSSETVGLLGHALRCGGAPPASQAHIASADLLDRNSHVRAHRGSSHHSGEERGRCSGCEKILKDSGKSPKPIFTVYRGPAKHVFCSGKCFKAHSLA